MDRWIRWIPSLPPWNSARTHRLRAQPHKIVSAPDVNHKSTWSSRNELIVLIALLLSSFDIVAQGTGERSLLTGLQLYYERRQLRSCQVEKMFPTVQGQDLGSLFLFQANCLPGSGDLWTSSFRVYRDFLINAWQIKPLIVWSNWPLAFWLSEEIRCS